MKTGRSKQFSVIDLFSGCGGSAEGFRRKGFEVKAAVDSNPIACESFRSNFPGSYVFSRSIVGLTGKEIMEMGNISDPDTTVILACPPCQGFSAARRVSQRENDGRNQLIFEFVRLVEEIRPVAFVMENVPGMVGPIGKEIFDRAMDRLKKVGYGSIVHDIFQVIDYGVPQKRKRLVVFGTRDSNVHLHLPIKTHGKTDEGLLPYSTVRQTLHDLPKLKAGEKSKQDPLHISSRLSSTNLERMHYTRHDGGDRSTWPDNLVNPCHRGKKVHPDTYTRMWWDHPSPTITGGCTMISKGRFAHPEQDRGISLREAARLQTFPDGFVFKGNFGQIALQIGNAVPVKFAECVAGTLADCLNQ
jgi:DNA (cytosine-5)-methyltransferase 1